MRSTVGVASISAQVILLDPAIIISRGSIKRPFSGPVREDSGEMYLDAHSLAKRRRESQRSWGRDG